MKNNSGSQPSKSINFILLLKWPDNQSCFTVKLDIVVHPVDEDHYPISKPNQKIQMQLQNKQVCNPSTKTSTSKTKTKSKAKTKANDTNTKIISKSIHPKTHNMKKIGHFGLFKEKSKSTLWPLLIQELI